MGRKRENSEKKQKLACLTCGQFGARTNQHQKQRVLLTALNRCRPGGRHFLAIRDGASFQSLIETNTVQLFISEDEVVMGVLRVFVLLAFLIFQQDEINFRIIRSSLKNAIMI